MPLSNRRKLRVSGAARAWLCLLPLLFLTLCACGPKRETVTAGGAALGLDTAYADLSGWKLTPAGYKALSFALPDCTIVWDVPIAGTRVSSASETVRIPTFSAEDEEALAFFPSLRAVEVTGTADCAALYAAQARYAYAAFSWKVALGKTVYASDAESLQPDSSVGMPALREALCALPAVKTVDLSGTAFTSGEIASLSASWPNLSFTLPVCGEAFDVRREAVTLESLTPSDAAALPETLSRFPHLESVDLRGCELSDQTKDALLAACPEADFCWTVTLPGNQTAASDAETLDFEGAEGFGFESLDALASALRYLPNVRSVNLRDCLAPSDALNERMERLMAAYPKIRFAWTVQMGTWILYTDTRSFAASAQTAWEGGRSLGYGQRESMTDETIRMLRYCTELQALDLGHLKQLTDLSPIANLTGLRFLILAQCRISDAEALRNLTNLEFLELWSTNITDITPLASCVKLRCLNLCRLDLTGCDVAAVVQNMQNLERLWLIHTKLGDGQLEAICAALPNTIVMTKGSHPTDSGWREGNALYREMQGVLHLPVLSDYASPGK